MSTPPNITYLRGPLGYAVLLDGKPFGRINVYRAHHACMVSVPGLRPTGRFTGAAIFPTVRAAKAAILATLMEAA